MCPTNGVRLSFSPDAGWLGAAVAAMVRLSGALSFYRTEAKRFRFWPPRLDLDAMNWRTRLSLIYAVSVWTMIGSVAFLQWKTGTGIQKRETDEDSIQDPSEQKSRDIPEDVKGIVKYEATVIYKENFVPYTTRIYQFFNSSKDTTAEK